MAQTRQQGKYKATMFLAIWQGNFIGIAFGGWLFNYADGSGPNRAAMMVLFWLGATHYVWNRARRVFWPEDVGQL